MSVEQLVVFNITLLAAMMSPGPAFLILVRTAIVDGRMAGVATGCGLALVAAGWTGAALAGLDSIFKFFPWAYVVVKTAGALYLVFIAWKLWTGAKNLPEQSSATGKRAFRQGLAVNLFNPKAVLFAGAVLIVIFPPDMTIGDKALIVANHLIVEVVVYSALAGIMSTQAVQRKYLKAKTSLDRGASIVLGALGLRLLFQR